MQIHPSHIIVNKCPIYTHDGASAKFSTYSHETDYSVGYPYVLFIIVMYVQLYIVQYKYIVPRKKQRVP